MKNPVRKLSIIITILFITLISCKDKLPTRDEIVKNNVEDYLKDKMDDPNSYEFVELRLVDSILFKDNIKYRKENFQNDLKYEKGNLERQEKYKAEIPSMYDEKNVIELKTKIERIKNILTKIDSLETNLGQKTNDVASYTYNFRCRGNNKLGAKILNDYILQTNPSPDFKVINLTDNKDKVYLNPNDFPGYREMISKFYE